ncbi:MAG TPA: hypothetical protein VF006_22760 [Longimicrobium sp.]
MPPLTNRLLRRLSLIIACAVPVAPALLRAQAEVRPGSQVRVLAPSAADSLIVARVVAIDSAGLLLAPPAPSAARTVRLEQIERIEVLRRGGRKTLAGALIGTVAGAAAGYFITTAYVSNSCDYICGAAEAGGAILGGMAGMVAGAKFGSGFRAADRWEPAAVPRR